MSNGFQHINSVFHTKKPINPVDGDHYYDSKLNRIFCYSGGIWIQYMLYHGVSKNEIRKDKIKNLLK